MNLDVRTDNNSMLLNMDSGATLSLSVPASINMSMSGIVYAGGGGSFPDDYAKESSVSDGDDTTIAILKDIATDAEIYAMFPGAVDENGYMSLDYEVNDDGYIVNNFTVDENRVLTLN